MTLHRLSDLRVRNAKTPGMLPDGGGLYLQVQRNKAGKITKSWIFRFSTGRTAISAKGMPYQEERQMGLGSLDTISLAKAREHARRCREMRLKGEDPIESRNAALRAKEVNAKTFDECASAYIAAHEAEWRNAEHTRQWSTTLKTFVSPVFGNVPVSKIDTPLVMKALESIWKDKTETASRLRGRIELVLSWAKVAGYRTGNNPAKWRGHLDQLLSAPAKRGVKHHEALPYSEINDFVRSLPDSVVGLALKFTILTAVRSGESIGARWNEINLADKVWTVPAVRTKTNREHRVPLSEPALAVLKRMAEFRQNEFVFPGTRGAALHAKAMYRLVEDKSFIVHGFRSTFRTWAAERTSFAPDVVEAALAHVVGDEVERAYLRSDLFQKRRRLMDSWAEFCMKPLGGKVRSIRSA
jgi:integrase